MSFKKIFFDEIDSTNTYLIENYKKYDNLSVIISEKQNQGRGQKNNKWVSQLGGLYFSILLKPQKLNSLISLIAGISVLEALNIFSEKKFKIKWPNDILLDKKKISGILVETKFIDNEIEYLIIGIGININQDELIENAISLKKIENKEFPILQVLDKFLDKFLENTKLDNQIIIDKINNNLFGIDDYFDILVNNNKIKAKILSINKEGYLIVNSNNKNIGLVSGSIII